MRGLNKAKFTNRARTNCLRIKNLALNQLSYFALHICDLPIWAIPFLCGLLFFRNKFYFMYSFSLTPSQLWLFGPPPSHHFLGIECCFDIIISFFVCRSHVDLWNLSAWIFGTRVQNGIQRSWETNEPGSEDY